MSGDTLAAAVLDGSLWNPPTHEDVAEQLRSAALTPSPPNTDDELGSDLSDYEPATTTSSSKAGGVKGVLRDKAERDKSDRLRQIVGRKEAGERMEARALLGLDYQSEQALNAKLDRMKLEKENEDADDERRKLREKRIGELKRDKAGRMRKRKGWLREVSMDGYLHALDYNGSDGNEWVTILVFEDGLPSLPYLIPSLLLLASLNTPPSHTFLLARSTTLQFSLLPSGEPDLDVLPTLLVYKKGELQSAIVRIDQEVLKDGKDGGIEGVLRKLGMPLNTVVPEGELSSSSDEEGDDEWNDDV